MVSINSNSAYQKYLMNLLLKSKMIDDDKPKCSKLYRRTMFHVALKLSSCKVSELLFSQSNPLLTQLTSMVSSTLEAQCTFLGSNLGALICHSWPVEIHLQTSDCLFHSKIFCNLGTLQPSKYLKTDLCNLHFESVCFAGSCAGTRVWMQQPEGMV